MKRIIVTAITALAATIAAYGQTLESATELYNAGATELNAGNMTLALENFEKALAEAEIIGFEAEEVASNCRSIIPSVILHIGKEYAVNNDLANAIPSLQKAIEKATEYGDNDTAAEAAALIPQLYIQDGNNKMNQKDFEAAVASYQKAVDCDSENAMAYLRLGMASSRTSNDELTVSALQKAAELGQAANADKQLSTFYLGKANKARQQKQFEMAMEYASKSNGIAENPTAHKIYAVAALSAKKYAEAAAGFEAYLALSPNANDANQMKYQAAVSYEAIGNKAKACGYYKQILTDPQFAEYAKHKVEVELKCN